MGKIFGGGYGELALPNARFDTVIQKMTGRMTKLQARRPSLMARVLFCNALLSSCLWFFAYFIVPSADQMKEFDAIVWGMIWGKEPGALNTRGKKSRGIVTGSRVVGGLQILLPSIMIPALQANMVCRAIVDRGRWWTRFLVWQLETAAPSRRGLDSLFLPAAQSALKSSSVFWFAATGVWLKLSGFISAHPLLIVRVLLQLG